MSKQRRQLNDTKTKHRSISGKEREERKQRVLTQGTPSIVQSIADAIVVKDEDLYFLTKPDGSVPLGNMHGFGLYYHDCRFLNGYELNIADTKPIVLASTAARGYTAVFQLTNPDIRTKKRPDQKGNGGHYLGEDD